MKNIKLIDTIILNGKVGMVETGDDADSVIGVLNVNSVVRFSGETLVVENGGFPLTKSMEEKIGWGSNVASVKIVTSPSPIEPDKIAENIIESYYGKIESRYHHHYSDLTGYLWTTQDFKVGGHDIPEILRSYMGEFIHMEIEIFEK